MNPAFFMKLMSFAMDCIPKDQLDVCSYIFRLGCGDIPPDEETPEYIRQYDTIVKEFLEGGKVITIHVDTGEVRCYKQSLMRCLTRGHVLSSMTTLSN